MSIRLVHRDQQPELFKDSRPEFVLAVVCDCGRRSVVHSEAEAQRTGSVHESHFCPNRCS